MTAELNASGDGPVRSPQDWKKVFREWKSAVRKKAREQRELNDVEHKLPTLTGTVAVTGQDLTELEIAEKVNGAAAEIDELEIVTYPYDNSEDGPENSPDEILVLEVENDTSASNKTKRRKAPDNPLLEAYKDGQETERKGLSDIAVALDNIAQGINRFCDLYESKIKMGSK